MKRTVKLRSSALALAAVAALSACGSAKTGASSALSAEALALTPIASEYSSRDKSGKYDDKVETIALSSDSITITEAGTYILTGTLADGQILVDAGDSDKVQLVLSGASVTCADGPAILVQNADKVFLTLAQGTENHLADGSSHADSEQNACVWAACDLTINGSGSLTVAGNYNHGVYAKDDLTITGGTIAVTAANDGLKGKDAVQIADGDITITAGGDGIQSSNTDADKGNVCIDGGSISITSDGDAIQAENRVQVTAGTLNLNAGGGYENGREHSGDMPGGFPGGNPPEMPEDGNFTPPEKPEDGDFTPPERSDGNGSTPPAKPEDGGFTPPERPAQTESANDTETSAEDTVSAKGLKGAGSLLVTGGSITADCADDTLHTNGAAGISGGTFTLRSGDDGVHADEGLFITGGTIAVQQSYEGLEGHAISISGGDIQINASDDGLNAAGGTDTSGDPFAVDEDAQIDISGGTITVSADGDGVDSNGDLAISGGTLYVDGPTSGADGAFDCNGTAAISGGTVVAAGSAGMAEGFGDTSTQSSFLTSLSASVPGGTTLTVTDSSGKTVLSYTPSKAYQSVCVSVPALKQGETYTVTAGEQSKTVTLDSVAVNEKSGGAPGGGKRLGSGSSGS